MKVFLGLIFILFIQSQTATAREYCGYGNLYKYVLCKIEVSQTYEVGYTEVRKAVTIQLRDDFFTNKEKFNVLGFSGKIERGLTPSVYENFVTLTLDQEIEGLEQYFTQKFEFPEVCNGVEPIFTKHGKVFLNDGTYSEKADFFVSCVADVSFDQD